MDIKGFELLSHVDFGGLGDCMQIMENRDHIYVGHMGYNPLGDEMLGTSVVDVRDKRNPRVVHQIPVPLNTHSHKTQVANDVLMINHEQQLRAGLPCSAGLKLFDISSPAEPVEIGWLPIDGLGVHRMWWAGDDLTYFSVRENGYHGRFLMSADVSDPTRPEIVERWWWPGQWTAGGETRTWDDGPTLRAHHIIAQGDRGYGGWGEAGLVILDLSDRKLELIANVEWASEINEPTAHAHRPPAPEPSGGRGHRRAASRQPGAARQAGPHLRHHRRAKPEAALPVPGARRRLHPGRGPIRAAQPAREPARHVRQRGPALHDVLRRRAAGSTT